MPKHMKPETKKTQKLQANLDAKHEAQESARTKGTFGGVEVGAEAEQPARPQGVQIIELYVENIKRVKLAHIKPKGDVVMITGRNGSGKTSVIDAITWGLTGQSEIPSQPIRNGERTGSIRMDLGDYILTRQFTRVDPEKSEKGNTYFTKLLIEGKHKEMFRSPQALLDGLMGKISFDPLAFTRFNSIKQLETLRGLVKLDIVIDMDALDAAQKVDYDARREQQRVVDGLAARRPRRRHRRRVCRRSWWIPRQSRGSWRARRTITVRCRRRSGSARTMTSRLQKAIRRQRSCVRMQWNYSNRLKRSMVECSKQRNSCRAIPRCRTPLQLHRLSECATRSTWLPRLTLPR